jgi:putative addiction module component (TIGR02574 family)
MPSTVEELGIDRMTVAERLALVGQIWDTLSAPVAELPTPAQADELDRRADDDDANPDDVVPWEQVKAAALARFAK